MLSVSLFLCTDEPEPPVQLAVPDHVLCICRCCYMGECEPVLSFPAYSHLQCERKDCLERLQPHFESSRRDAIRVLQSSQNCASDKPCTLANLANATRLTSTEICIVINLLERETCIGHDKCKSTTTIDAHYVSNHWVWEKFVVFSFLSTILVLSCASWLQDLVPFMIEVLRKRYHR